ncbi:hypothetical protein Trichorick_00873 [Candidatus Trichorickettsia mobilis]|uniref:HTH cro/C1-type domain-containing protein n=1 Tax=Candidatus Trichorickettsia mobilis TaxID=1346319 RepID=A0ABZ0UVI2_9RICK|nr:hypothetical protein [Candidatus Trichorickettsia mobilis]WPY00983.1 hypothetical protein Trichorick_00873 [Candidatus Trichorickettsia mobilis]
MDLKQLGSRLQYIRKQAGLSREYIEKTYNIPAVTIRSWEILGPDIGIYKLVKYLEIYKNYGLNFSLDVLLDTTKNFILNYNQSVNEENRFLNSSFCLRLLQDAMQVFFYANERKEILYLSNICKNLLPSTNKELVLTNITIQNIIPSEEYEKCLVPIADVLSGKLASITYSINKQNTLSTIELSLLPNFDKLSNVIGFVATQPTAMFGF